MRRHHSALPKEKIDIRFSAPQVHISGEAESSTKISKTKILDASQKDKISSAEAMWMPKVAEQDYSLRSRDGVPKLFQTKFSHSNITKGFSMSRQKGSYIVSDELGPLLGKRVCNDTASSKGTFTALFDETTTVQNKKTNGCVDSQLERK